MSAYEELGRRLSNWTRWGPGDQRGTLNHITAECIVAAAQLVRHGRVFDLGIPVGRDGPQPGGLRVNPLHFMGVTHLDDVGNGDVQAADDWLVLPTQAGTQWDALAHIAYGDRMYNNFPTSDVSPVHGARSLSIENQSPLVTRGVLLDIARLRGVVSLDPATPIMPAELTAAAEHQRVDVRRGDVVLIRTGWWRRFTGGLPARDWMAGEPGLTLDCAEWLHERDVAAVAADNFAVEVLPSVIPGEPLPLHCVLLRDMGMPMGEIFDLEQLAADCEHDGVWEFLFSAPPLKVVGGVGSPINPLAVK